MLFLLAGLKFTSSRFLLVVLFVIFTKTSYNNPANRNTQPMCKSFRSAPTFAHRSADYIRSCVKAFSLSQKPSTHLRIGKIPSGKQAFRGNFANPRFVGKNRPLGRFFPMTARLRRQSGNHRCIRTTFSQLPPLTHSGAEPLGSSPKRRQSRAVISCNVKKKLTL